MNRVALVAAIGFGLVAAGVTFLVIRGSSNPEASFIAVVTAGEPLDRGAIIAEDQLEVGRVKVASAGETTITEVSQAVGKTTLRSLPAGAVLDANDLTAETTTDVVDHGMRAFIITVEAKVGAAKLVTAGDRVDVLYVDSNTGKAEMIAQNVSVLRVMDKSDGDEAGDSQAGLGSGESVDLLVEVDPEKTPRLFAAHASGMLSVSLRSRSDSMLALVAGPVPAASPEAPPESAPAPEQAPAEEEPAPSPETTGPQVTMPVPASPGALPAEQPGEAAEPDAQRKRITIVRGSDQEVIEVDE